MRFETIEFVPQGGDYWDAVGFIMDRMLADGSILDDLNHITIKPVGMIRSPDGSISKVLCYIRESPDYDPDFYYLFGDRQWSTKISPNTEG